MNGSPVAEAPTPTNGNGTTTPATPNVNLMAMSRPLYHKGIQTVTWDAKDPNDDDLSFDVFYRGDGENLWRVLRDDLIDPVIAWDTVAMPDGRYYLKIVASDELSNPKEVSRTGERTSRSFEVDNTPPRINGLSTTPNDVGHRVQFVAQDDISAIRSVEYSVNSGGWRMVFPTDGIADSTNESFDFPLEGFGDGVYTLVVKVTDSLGNAATARAELR